MCSPNMMYNTTERLRNSALHDFYKHVDRIGALKAIKRFRTIVCSLQESNPCQIQN